MGCYLYGLLLLYWLFYQYYCLFPTFINRKTIVWVKYFLKIFTLFIANGFIFSSFKSPAWRIVYLTYHRSVFPQFWGVNEATCQFWRCYFFHFTEFQFCSNISSHQLPLHKKWSFPIRIPSVNVNKSAVFCWFRHIYWRNP